jgi:hypothetical protein
MMTRTKLIAATLAAVCGVAGCVGLGGYKRQAELPQLADSGTYFADYRKVEIELPVMPQLVNPDFADGTAGWKIGAGFSAAPGQGINSTGALFYERTDPQAYALAVQEAAFQPGGSYRISAMIRCEGVKGEDKAGASIAVEFYKDGKYLDGKSPVGVKGTSDWTRVETTFTVPADPDIKGRIHLYMRRGLTGKAWFTGVQIEPVIRPAEAHLVLPVQERFLTDSGRFVIRWVYPLASNSTPQTRVEIRSGGEVLKAGQFACNSLVTQGDLGSLPVGEFTLHAVLFDPSAKTILHEAEFPVTCVKPSDIPAHAVRVDEKGRTFVDGKPFMPVGLVTHWISPENLKDFSKSPFNCVMPYFSLYLKFEKTQKAQGQFVAKVEQIREVLDACAAANVKVIYSIKDLYENAHWAGGLVHCPKSWNGMTGEKEIVTAVVKNFRDHPALLAWYTSDEMLPAYNSRLIERRRLVRALDPWHPTWGLYNWPDEVVGMLSNADVQGIDPYPIRDRNSRSMGWLDSFASTVQASYGVGGGGGGLPHWAMPQAHNAGLYTMVNGRRWDRVEDREALLAKHHNPTEEEMRTMSLLFAIKGARGFVFYSYHDLVKPAVLPDYPQRWKELCNVGALLQELAPFLYSDEKAPQVTVKTTKGKVNAAAYKTSDGKVKVLITGNGPGESEAEIFVPDAGALTSRFGKTEPLGRGAYRFKGNDICSDLLE